MAKTIELFYTNQNGCPSFSFRIADVIEGNAKAKFQEMLNDLPAPIADSLKSLPPARLLSGDEVEVQTMPASTENAHSVMPPAENRSCSEATNHPPQTLPNREKTNPKKNDRKSITEKQLRTIHQALSDRHIPVAAFCRSHGVDRIENLSKGEAWKIINERNF